MANTGSSIFPDRRMVVVHSARTAFAAIVSLLIAQAFRLHEPFWAPITTLVITQSSLGAALEVSRQRFVGTTIGAVVGAVAAACFEPNANPAVRVIVFGVCVFLLGIICELPRLGMTAYRFGGVTVVIVLMVPSQGAPWHAALHRFAAVSIGIVAALVLAKLWPEREPAQG